MILKIPKLIKSMSVELPSFPGNGSLKSYQEATKGPRFIAKPKQHQSQELIDRHPFKSNKEVCW